MDLPILDGSVGIGTILFLVLALGIALAFEFVNGFHDTANAVATVIYTRSMGPKRAVVWSGLCNFLGVYLGGIGVAYAMVQLLPVDLLIDIGSRSGMGMVLALLLSAILWNLGTWYLAIPASSSHTLIGAILGVGLASSLVGQHGHGVNWNAAFKVGLSLLLSPLFGFALAALLLLALLWLARNPQLHRPPEGDKPPPWWIRSVLMLTCTGVSFFHGSNDGQKGMGLIMLILIGLLPAQYALNRRAPESHLAHCQECTRDLQIVLLRAEKGGDPAVQKLVGDIRRLVDEIREILAEHDLGKLDKDAAWRLRTDILRINSDLETLAGAHSLVLPPEERAIIHRYRDGLRRLTEYVPTWVQIAVAFALGIGTMVGWKRIVVTVGEKIGKAHLTYAQGAAAEVVAMGAIGAADYLHLPVSTTHVLSSGVAGTMAAAGAGVQGSTIKKIALAWVLTLPVCMLLSGGLFLLFHALAG